MAPVDRPYTTFSWSANVNTALSGAVFELFDVEIVEVDATLSDQGHSN